MRYAFKFKLAEYNFKRYEEMMHLIKSFRKKIISKTINGWQSGKGLLHLNEKFFRQAKGCRIIVYHGICLKNHTKFNGIFLNKVAFEQHLLFYKKFFNVVSLADYYSGNMSNEKFNVCITFDDGYLNNYKYALPLMEKYKIPMCFFVTGINDAGFDILWNDYLGIVTKYGHGKIYFANTYFIKKSGHYISVNDGSTLRGLLQKNDFNIKLEMMEYFDSIVSFKDKNKDEDFWQQMNKAEIKKLSGSPYATIGSHGYYHNDLSEISVENCKNELQQSKFFLEKICNKNIDAIAFPYGNYSGATITEAKNSGYKKLLALNYKSKEDEGDDSIKERMIINPYISVTNQMYAIIKGKYE